MNSIRVLHVDDEPDIREVVDISLRIDPDFTSRSCSSGGEALAVAAEWSPAIILLDVMMPVMDGPATLARLRDRPETADISVVFMTARAQSHELSRFRSLGAAGTIPKPFDPMTLAAEVRAFVRPVSDPFGAMHDVFLKRAADDGGRLASHQFVLRDGRASAATLEAVEHLAHGLAGAAGIFGFHDIGNAAAALEQAIIARPGDSFAVGAIDLALDRLLFCIMTYTTARQERAAPVSPRQLPNTSLTGRA